VPRIETHNALATKYLLLGFCLVLVSLWIRQPAFAQSSFEVRHAQTQIKDGSYYLNADIDYMLHSEAREILQRGLPIKIALQVELFRERRYWRDKIINQTEAVYVLQFNPVTEHYVLRNVDEGSQKTFFDADSAISDLSKLQNVLLVAENKLINPNLLQARARLIVDVRHFPEPLQYLAKYWGEWHLTSEWYVWPLKL